MLLLLPGLLLVQAARGRDVLLHVHSGVPVHVHLLQHGGSGHTHVHEHGHDHGLGHELAHEAPGDERHCTFELRLCSLQPLLPRSAQAFDPGRWIPSPARSCPAEVWRSRPVEPRSTLGKRPPDRPPTREHRSVLRSLLTSSRALLI